MSGIEVAGLALALFPIVIELVDAYSGALTGRDINHLAESLKNHQQIFLNAVEYLLHYTIPAQQLRALLADPSGALWQDQELNDSVQRELGIRAASILGKISDIHKTITKLMAKLPIPDGNSTIKDRATRVIKCFVRGPYYKASLERLRMRISEFRTLTKDALKLAPSRSGLVQDLEILELIKQCAGGLYEACRAGWKCDCSHAHPANIRLNVDHRKDDHGQECLTFSFLFAEHAHRAHHEHWMTAEIVAPKEKGGTLPPLTFRTLSGSTAVSSTSVPVVIPAPAPSIAPSGALPCTSCVSDLCTILKSCQDPVRPARRRLGSISDSKGQNYDLFSRPDPITTKHSVVVAEYFEQKSVLSNRFRVELALMLAKGVLQMSSTSWLEGKWTKHNILLVTDAPNSLLPYVSHRFESAGRSSTSSTLVPTTPDSVEAWIRNPTMFSLGVLLLEVCYNRSIESLAANDEKNDFGKAWTYTPFLTAMRLSKTVQNELGLRYAQAVRACLDFPGVEPNLTGMPKESTSFASSMMKDIVDPLKVAVETFVSI
ncbi:unnamed protein product [Zymoseptoria tritici ST99CH_1A5]|nr:unnamed protein product [Zymoseptoria tritici ST99CH_1E4]SMY24243.1 unnamed protein product [Zymoseptoria tritici ST99CH_1A5]